MRELVLFMGCRVVGLIFERSPDIIPPDCSGYDPPIVGGNYCGEEKGALVLLEEGCGARQGWTALVNAGTGGRTELDSALLKRAADVNAKMIDCIIAKLAIAVREL